MAPCVAKILAVGGEQLADYYLRLTAVSALIVAELDECHGRPLWPSYVVTLGNHLVGEVEQLVSGFGELAGSQTCGEQPDNSKHDPGQERRHKRRCQNADLGFLELPCLEGQARN